MIVEEQSQGRPSETELPPDAILQETTVRKVHERGIVYGKDEGGRVRARLGGVIDAQPPSFRGKGAAS